LDTGILKLFEGLRPEAIETEILDLHRQRNLKSM